MKLLSVILPRGGGIMLWPVSRARALHGVDVPMRLADNYGRV